MKWAEDACWEVAAADLQTRLLIGRHIMSQIKDDYQRADTRAAEAIMVASTISDSEFWSDCFDNMRA